MDDRREGERRESERREHREQEGRRDDAAGPRRLGRRRYILPAALLLLAIVVLLGYRIAVVAPRALAAAAADAAWMVVEPVMARLQLPLVALPKMAGPGAGPLAPVQPPLDGSEQSMLQALLERLEAVARRSPQVVDVQAAVATVRLLLGDERGARMAWESVLSSGDSEQRQHALLGLGVIALRTSCRLGSQQDRGFSFEHALSYFLQLTERADSLLLPEALFNQAVTLVALGRIDAAEVAMARLERHSDQEVPYRLLRDWLEAGAPVSFLPPNPPLPTIKSLQSPSPEPGGP